MIFMLVGSQADEEAELEALRNEVIRLREELNSVLDVAIVRGQKLGYVDEWDKDYKARFEELTGREWSNET